MLVLKTTAKFRKDYKRARKQGKPLAQLAIIIDRLLAEETLEPKYRDHALSSLYEGFRECHIQPDWLLIYAVDKGQLVLTAVRTGSHSELFSE